MLPSSWTATGGGLHNGAVAEFLGTNMVLKLCVHALRLQAKSMLNI
jgi:hypothetical protein